MCPSKVLLADDDPRYGDAMERELLATEYEVRRATDGIEVLEALREELPDILILDLVLPRLSGDAIVAMIRQDPSLRHLPVVILSGALVERGAGDGLAAETRIPKGPLKATARDLLAAVAALGPRGVPRRPRRSPRSPAARRQVVELLRTTAYYEAIMNSLGQGLLEVDDRGKILLVNLAAERILGTDRSVLLGTNILDQLPEARESRLPRLLQEAPGSGPNTPRCYLSTAGQTLKIQIVPLSGNGSEESRMLLLQDLTLETTLDRRKADLLGYICQELRGALTPIGASLNGLADVCQARDADRGMLDSVQRVKEEIHRLLEMIEDLRAVAGNEVQLFNLPLAPVDMRELAERVVSLQQAQAATKGVRIRMEMPPMVPPVLGNRDKLCQVLHNLLTNAIRYSPPGEEIQVRMEARGGGLVTSVEDRGPGIPPNKREHLFRTFHLGSGLHKDHGGLGLAISKGILDSHHGLIWAEEAEPCGARLMFLLRTTTDAIE